MMKLVIEGLKPMYETLSKAISQCNIKGTRSYDEQYGALNEMCRMILCSQTIYDGMTMPQLIMHIEQDMRFVSDQMTEEEESLHIKYHWDLIAERDKELQQFMAEQGK